MTFTLVRQDNGNIGNGAGPFNLVLGAAPSAGDVIVLGCDISNIAIDPANAVSSANTTWTKVQWIVGTYSNTQWVGVAAAGASATISITPSGNTASSLFAAAFTWSGGPDTILAGQTSSTTGTSTTPTTPNATPVTGHESLVIGLMRRGNTFASGPSNGFTDFTTGSALFRMAYLVTSAGGPVNTAWTYTGSAAWDTQIYVLESSTPGSSFKSAFARNANSYLSAA